MPVETSLENFFNVFKPNALEKSDFEYYQEMAKERNGDVIQLYMRLYKLIIKRRIDFRHLLIGHLGCGKSTEINKLVDTLENNNYTVFKIEALEQFDANNVDYVDLIINIILSLLNKCEEQKIDISSSLRNALYKSMGKTTTINNYSTEASSEINAGASAEFSIPWLLKFFSNLTSSIKFSAETGNEVRTELKPRVELIITSINLIIAEIKEKTANSILLIVDGLEKCNLANTRKLFIEGSAALASIEIGMLLCCPIGIMRSVDANLIKSFFSYEYMPMIKIKKYDGTENEVGIEALKNMVYKRVAESCFDGDSLKYIILKSGGSLRQLCTYIPDIAFDCYLEGLFVITEAMCERYFKRIRSDIFLYVENKLHAQLKEIYEGPCKTINNPEYAELLYSGAVYEYNGTDKWCDLNPLLRDYIDDNGVACLE